MTPAHPQTMADPLSSTASGFSFRHPRTGAPSNGSGAAWLCLLPVVLFVAISLALVADFRIDKEFSADGIYRFYAVLEWQVWTVADPSRRFAEYINQWPLILALRSGVSDFAWLKAFFCLGLFLPYLFAFLLSLYAVRGQGQFLICFFLVSILAVNLASDYHLTGENQVMSLLSWPILLLSLRRPAISRLDALITWSLLVLLSATYPIAAVTASIVAVVLGIRLHHGECAETTTNLWLNLVTIVLCVGVVLINSYYILFPLYLVSRDSFQAGILLALVKNPLGISGSVFSVLFAMALIRRERMYSALCVLPTLGYLWYVFSNERGLSAGVSFSSRTLTLTVLPLLLTLAALTSPRAVQFRARHALVAVAFVFAGALGVLVSSNDWDRFRGQFHQILESRTGYVPIQETPLRASSDSWPWNNSLLSVVWSYPCVRAIVLNATPVGWQPFDPKTTLILKRYVRYARPLSDIDPTVGPCS
jgi:hypothetical protein